ncbi:MAG TPA: sensor histidine kinase, partial [Streptosporangiaceae bacterium]
LSVGDPAVQLSVGFVSYLVPSRFPRRQALVLLGATLAALAVGLAVFATTRHGGLQVGGERAALAALAESALLVGGSWAVGYIIVQQRVYARAVRDQAERDDRIRIARELHDVVAHGLSLIAVQAGVANWVVESQPAEAARALSSIEEISRGALREMRALLGVLRVDDDGEPGLEPTRGLADLRALTDRVTAAGIEVTLDVSGTPAAIAPGLDLAAYRVVQEAVTNVVKHSGAGRCRVGVTYAADALTVEITDDGRGPAESSGGQGLRGMRERVAMYSGTFEAGPRPAGGFGVTARFPA